jgi:hypothetical protein
MSGRWGNCQVCSHLHAVNLNGLVRGHRVTNHTAQWCPGSHHLPMSNHSIASDDISAAILAAATHPTQGVLALHFFQAYDVGNVDEALEAADGIEQVLERNQLVVAESANVDKLNAVVSSARQIMKLRKAGVPARDTRWKIAWRDLEDQLDG